MGKSLRIGTFISFNLLNNPPASCSLKNFEFLLSQTTQFDESIILPFLSSLQTIRYHSFINRLKSLTDCLSL